MSKELLSEWMLVVACFAGLLGCSSSSDTMAKNGGGAAAAQCDALVEKLCTQIAPCEQKSQSDCVSEQNQDLKQKYGDTCSGADQVGSTYQACMTDLDQPYACGGPLPASCQEVIIFFIQK